MDELSKADECQDQATDGIHCATCAGLSVARIKKLDKLNDEASRAHASAHRIHEIVAKYMIGPDATMPREAMDQIHGETHYIMNLHTLDAEASR